MPCTQLPAISCGETLSPEQLHEPFEQALREGHLVPVCFVSAETGAGVGALLTVVERLMPHPAEGNPPPFLAGAGGAARRVEVRPDPQRHVIAHVFRVTIDPYVGKLACLRVHQGTIRPGAPLYVGDARLIAGVASRRSLSRRHGLRTPYQTIVCF